MPDHAGRQLAAEVCPVEWPSHRPLSFFIKSLFQKATKGDKMNDSIPMTQSENVLYTISEIARLLKVNKDMVYEPMLSAGVGTSTGGCFPVLIPPSGEQIYTKESRNGISPPFFDDGVTSTLRVPFPFSEHSQCFLPLFCREALK